jgi:hypothetical protein
VTPQELAAWREYLAWRERHPPEAVKTVEDAVAVDFVRAVLLRLRGLAAEGTEPTWPLIERLLERWAQNRGGGGG